MPTYVYRCPSGHEFEELKSIKEIDEPTPCMECAAEGKVVQAHRIPTTFTGRVVGGTPTFYPGRDSK